jgi:hypothetical protein
MKTHLHRMHLIPRLAAVLAQSALVLASACGIALPEDESAGATFSATLSAQSATLSLLQARSDAIKGVTAVHPNIHNPLLYAGIAYTETQTAHCYSEYTSQVGFACAGPAATACGGGAVTAGGGDGACSLQQGGLGMFQFDEGTYTQTLNKWNTTGYWNNTPRNILDITGTIYAAIDFINFKAWNSAHTPTFSTDQDMYNWINNIRPVDGDANWELWLGFLSNSYNGQTWGSAGWSSTKELYRSGTKFMYNTLGGSTYWYGTSSAPWCSASCGGGGWWCAGDGSCIQNGAAGHNYHCPGNNMAPDVDQACPAGCAVAASGSPDYCKTTTNCGAGKWCGNDCVGGFAKTLYTTSSTGAITSVTHCQIGFANKTCVIAPAGTNDSCN